MAIVKVKFVKHAQNLLRYVVDAKSPNDPVRANDCDERNPLAGFEAIGALNGNSGTTRAVHIVQSWSAEESKMLKPEEFNGIGVKLAETRFPGHAFFVVTHTDTGKTHNHIVVSPWHAETGKKIENKKRLLYELRAVSDTLCKERGLSVIDRLAKDREARLPDKVQKMARFNGRSWLLDLCQKADFARSYSTSYDEFVGILSVFGVAARVEDKNITYFYQGKERGKRGSKLGRLYDKHGLEETFRTNDEKFTRIPTLRSEVRGIVGSLAASGGSHDGAKKALSSISETTYAAGQRDYSRFTKMERGEERKSSHHLALESSIVPVNEIIRASNTNIIRYCQVNNIALSKNPEGRTVMKGREFVEISEHEWTNKRNRTKGSLIELVAAHKGISLLGAIAEINSNPRLLLLEQHFGETKRTFTSFYIPTGKRLEELDAKVKIARLLEAHGSDAGHAATLHRFGQAQVDHSGRIRIFGKDDEGGAFEFEETEPKNWSKSKVGSFKKPFFAMSTGTKQAALYTDPFTFMSHQGKPAFRGAGRGHDVLALMEPDESLVDQFLAGNRHVKELHIFTGPLGHQTTVELDFFNNLKGKYKAHGIEVIQMAGHELSRGREPDMPSL